MGLTRVFRRSVRFTFRSKRRFIVFLLIFAIVSTLIAFYVDGLDDLQTDALLEQKGVTVKKAEGATIDYNQGLALYSDVLSYAESSADVSIEASMMFTYTDVDESLRIHSIDIENPWISDFAKPSLLTEGRFPNAPNEILVPDGAFQSFELSGQAYSLNSILSVGQILDFHDNEGNEIELEVVGKFDDSQYGISNQNDQLWLFMDEDQYEDMLDFFGMTHEDDSKIYMLSFVVEGLILFPETYEQADTLNDRVRQFLEDEQSYGNFEDVPEGLPLPETLQTSRTIIVTLGFVVLGGIILATLFAYLITRFRRREIAILKAMGYAHAAVRTSLFGELLTTSFSGFIFGLGLAQGLLFYLNELEFAGLIRLPAVGISFLIMVVVALPGMLLTSRRVLSVSPAEAFRDN